MPRTKREGFSFILLFLSYAIGATAGENIGGKVGEVVGGILIPALYLQKHGVLTELVASLASLASSVDGLFNSKDKLTAKRVTAPSSAR